MKVVCSEYKKCNKVISRKLGRKRCIHTEPHEEMGCTHNICTYGGMCIPVPITYYMEKVLDK